MDASDETLLLLLSPSILTGFGVVWGWRWAQRVNFEAALAKAEGKVFRPLYICDFVFSGVEPSEHTEITACRPMKSVFTYLVMFPPMTFGPPLTSFSTVQRPPALLEG